MSFDEGLGEHIRGVLEAESKVTEKEMFGGLAFILDGKMCCGVVKGEMMARVGPDAHEKSLKQSHARPMDFTGRPMKGFISISEIGLRNDAKLHWWISQCVTFLKAESKKTTKSKSKSKKLLKKK